MSSDDDKDADPAQMAHIIALAARAGQMVSRQHLQQIKRALRDAAKETGVPGPSRETSAAFWGAYLGEILVAMSTDLGPSVTASILTDAEEALTPTGEDDRAH